MKALKLYNESIEESKDRKEIEMEKIRRHFRFKDEIKLLKSDGY